VDAYRVSTNHKDEDSVMDSLDMVSVWGFDELFFLV